MSRPIAKRSTLLLAAVAALMVAAFASVPAAQASTLYACVSKSGTAHVYTKKPKKCKSKKEKLVSWNTAGPKGANGANGTNGTNGSTGPAGQPQTAVTFSSTVEAELLSDKFTTLFTLAGVTVKLDCGNALVADITSLQAFGPAGTHAISGMASSKSNSKEVTEQFQQNVYNVSVATTGTPFASIATDNGTPKGNIGHVNASITTPGGVVFIDAFIEAKESPGNCIVLGSAYTIPD